jgi:AcrR family transcriptional regulator
MPRSKEANEQMRAQSRAEILSTSRRLFAERGYFACKVSDIAREAGMSQGNIYWYFPSKEEVLKAILAEGFEAVDAALETAASHPGTGLEKLNSAVEQYIVLGQDGADFFTIFMSLLAHGGVPLLRALGFDTMQIGMGYHQRLADIIAQAQSEGSLEDIDPTILTMFFFSFFNGLIVTYDDVWLQLSPQLIQSAILRLLGGTTSWHSSHHGE